jgi:integrase
VTVYIGSAGGKKRYRAKMAHGSKKQAQRVLRELLAEKDRGTLLPSSRQTVTDFLEAWIQQGCPTTRQQLPGQRTRRDYEEDSRRYLLPELGGYQLERLTTTLVQQWIEKRRAEGLAPRTVTKGFAALRGALNSAVRRGILARNPCALVNLPKVERRELTTLGGADEVNRFLTAARTDRYEALWYCLLLGGIRPGEASALTWDGVPVSDGSSGEAVTWEEALKAPSDRSFVVTIRVRRALTFGEKKVPEMGVQARWTTHAPKTSKSRRAILLPDPAFLALKRHRVRQSRERLRALDYALHGFVFADPRGQPVYATRLRKRFRRILKAAGLPEHVRVYDSRHSCATLLLSSGVHPQVVQERLGHSTIAMTMDTYSEVLPTLQQDATERLGRMIAKG